MGVIKSQATSQIVVNYAATIISFFAVILIYPLDENKGYGQAQFVSITAMFLVPFVTLGTHSVTVKFFPEFKGEKQKGYLSNVTMIAMTTSVLFFALAYLLREPIYGFMGRLNFNVEYLRIHSVPLVVTTFFVMLAKIFTLHSTNYNKITIPALLNNLLPKVALPILILLVYFGAIDYMSMVWWWTAVFGMVALVMFAYLRPIGAMDMKWRPRDLSNGMLGRIMNYAIYNGLTLMGSMLANRLDVIMVTLLLGDKENGVYLTAMFIAATIQIPTNAVWQITSPQLARAWNENRLDEISKLYKRSSSNLFVSGVVLYFICLGNVDPVFSLTANYEALAAGIPAFALLGAGKLFDMITSINTQIIMYSRDYKVNTAFVLVLGAANVLLNYWLIGLYGLTGAALATAISVLLYNVMKTAYIYFKHGMHPFDKDIFRLLLFAVLCGLVYYFFPRIENPFIHIAVFTSVLGLFSLIMIRLLRINTDFIPFFKTKAIQAMDRFIGRKS